MSFWFDEFFAEGAFEVDFPGGNVEHAVVETLCDFGEFAVDEFAVLVDGVAGEDDGVVFAEVGVEEGEEVLFDGFDGLAVGVVGDKGVVRAAILFPEGSDHAGFDGGVVNFDDGLKGGKGL